jgi:hypothetical protein
MTFRPQDLNTQFQHSAGAGSCLDVLNIADGIGLQALGISGLAVTRHEPAASVRGVCRSKLLAF